jgi:acid phosphatase (class A)
MNPFPFFRQTRPLAQVLFFSLASALAGHAQTFLAPDAVNIAALLPPPPGDTSPAGRADLETVLQVQADRTPAQIERAQRVAAHTPFLMGSFAFGPWFTPENLPRTAALFKLVREQSRPFIEAAKKTWSRPRPYDRDPRVQPVVDRPHNTSYPSGHSAESAIWASILTEAFPDRRDVFEDQVRETMWGRVLGGAHFPSDTQAGRDLGEAIGKAMLKTIDMKKAIEEIRAEVAPFVLKKAA